MTKINGDIVDRLRKRNYWAAESVSDARFIHDIGVLVREIYNNERAGIVARSSRPTRMVTPVANDLDDDNEDWRKYLREATR